MNYLQDLANLIAVRNFLIASQEDMRIKLTAAKSKEIETKLSTISNVLVEKALALNLDKTFLSDTVNLATHRWETTEDLEKVLAKFNELTEKKSEVKSEVELSTKKSSPKKVKPVSNEMAKE